MKVKLKTLMAGPGGCFQPGEVIDVKEAEARALVSGNYAEAVGKWPDRQPPEQTPGGTGTEGESDAVQRAGDPGAGAGDGGNGEGAPAPAAGRKRK